MSTILYKLEPEKTSKEENNAAIKKLKDTFKREIRTYKQYTATDIHEFADEIEKGSWFEKLTGKAKARKVLFDYAAAFMFDNVITPTIPEIYTLKTPDSGVTPLHFYAISATSIEHYRWIFMHPKSADPQLKAKGWDDNTPAHLAVLSFGSDAISKVSKNIIKSANCWKTENKYGETPVTLLIKRLIGDDVILGIHDVRDLRKYFDDLLSSAYARMSNIKIENKEVKIEEFLTEFLERAAYSPSREREEKTPEDIVSSIFADAFNAIRDENKDMIATAEKEIEKGESEEESGEEKIPLSNVEDVGGEAKKLIDIFNEITKGEAVKKIGESINITLNRNNAQIITESVGKNFISYMNKINKPQELIKLVKNGYKTDNLYKYHRGIPNKGEEDYYNAELYKYIPTSGQIIDLKNYLEKNEIWNELSESYSENLSKLLTFLTYVKKKFKLNN